LYSIKVNKKKFKLGYKIIFFFFNSEKKLVLYLKQILKAAVIIENYYQTWSYVKSTGKFQFFRIFIPEPNIKFYFILKKVLMMHLNH
jgi:hypothetical protein